MVSSNRPRFCKSNIPLPCASRGMEPRLGSRTAALQHCPDVVSSLVLPALCADAPQTVRLMCWNRPWSSECCPRPPVRRVQHQLCDLTPLGLQELVPGLCCGRTLVLAPQGSVLGVESGLWGGRLLLP